MPVCAGWDDAMKDEQMMVAMKSSDQGYKGRMRKMTTQLLKADGGWSCSCSPSLCRLEWMRVEVKCEVIRTTRDECG